MTIFGWQRFYEAAILETDRTRLPQLIQAAQSALDVRIEQLRIVRQNHAEEREAISSALAGLRQLKHDAKR